MKKTETHLRDQLDRETTIEMIDTLHRQYGMEKTPEEFHAYAYDFCPEAYKLYKGASPAIWRETLRKYCSDLKRVQESKTPSKYHYGKVKSVK